MCVRLHNDGPAHGRGGLVTFVLAKVTKTVSAEMLLCATGLCAQNRGKPWAATSFAGLTLSLQYPVCEKLLCPGPIHRLAGFPRFFPKLFCGREGYFHDTVIAETKPFIVLG